MSQPDRTTLEVPEELYDKIESLASQEGLTVDEYAEKLLRDIFAELKGEKP